MNGMIYSSVLPALFLFLHIIIQSSAYRTNLCPLRSSSLSSSFSMMFPHNGLNGSPCGIPSSVELSILKSMSSFHLGLTPPIVPSSPGIHTLFPTYTCSVYCWRSVQLLDFGLFGNSIHASQPVQTTFTGQWFASGFLQPHLATTPLPLAAPFPLLDGSGTCTP